MSLDGVKCELSPLTLESYSSRAWPHTQVSLTLAGKWVIEIPSALGRYTVPHCHELSSICLWVFNFF